MAEAAARRNVPACAYCKDKDKEARGLHTIAKCPFIRCRTCSQLGHTDRDCAALPCDECGAFSHLTADCYRLQTCARCQRKGHITDMCHQVLCDYCSRIGHSADTCFAKQRDNAPARPPRAACEHCNDADHATSKCPFVFRRYGRA